jgi:hypothetical protein
MCLMFISQVNKPVKLSHKITQLDQMNSLKNVQKTKYQKNTY